MSTFFAGACCIWSAVTNTWWHLFIARFFLGLGFVVSLGLKVSQLDVVLTQCNAGSAPSLQLSRSSRLRSRRRISEEPLSCSGKFGYVEQVRAKWTRSAR